jgi:chaperone modulatory protein CbpM
MKLRRRIEEVCIMCGTSEEIVMRFIQEEWLIPIDREHITFDEEDVARIHLIIDLKNQFGVNDEAVPIILHLIDQLNAFRQFRKDLET